MSSNLSVIDTLSITLSDSDLADAIAILVRARNDRQANQMLEMKNTLVKGDLVEFYHSGKGKYIRGTVKKTKTKKGDKESAGSALGGEADGGEGSKLSKAEMKKKEKADKKNAA